MVFFINIHALSKPSLASELETALAIIHETFTNDTKTFVSRHIFTLAKFNFYICDIGFQISINTFVLYVLLLSSATFFYLSCKFKMTDIHIIIDLRNIYIKSWFKEYLPITKIVQIPLRTSTYCKNIVNYASVL